MNQAFKAFWSRENVVVAVVCLILAASLSFVAMRWGSRREATSPMPSAVVPQAPLANWPPTQLHYDASDETVSDLTVGDVPLSYGYLMAHPESDYAALIKRLVRLVDDNGSRFVVNFRPAEAPGSDVAMMLGAACLAEQNQDYFWTYHRAAMAASGPWGIEQITSVADGLGADLAKLRACLGDERRRAPLTRVWEPEALTRVDLLARVFVAGQSASADVVACDHAQPASMDAGETVACLEKLAARLNEDVQKTVAGQPIKVTYLSNGKERPLAALASVSGRESLVLKRVSKVLNQDDYIYDLYATPTDIVRIGPLDGRVYTGEGRILGDELYLTTTEPAGLRRVSLKTGKLEGIAVEGGAWAEAGQRLAYFERLGNRLYYFSHGFNEGRYAEVDWRLKELDLKTGKVRQLAKWEEFDLYSGPTKIKWDETRRRVLVTVSGGDGGVGWSTTYSVDPTGAHPTDLKKEVIHFACADAADNERCTAEEIAIAKSAVLTDERLEYLKVHGCEGANGSCRCGDLVIPRPADLAEFIGCITQN